MAHASNTQAAANRLTGFHEQNDKQAKVLAFQIREPDMMPGDWAEPGNPTPYELRVTFHTCKRAWRVNQEALNHPECDRDSTLENIRVLEKLYIHLMDYLGE